MQDRIFLEKEGDSYFNRNESKLAARKFDAIFSIIDAFDIKPKKVLDIGAANGILLSQIYKKYKSECCAVEPSENAVNDGSKKFPFIKFYRTTASTLPFEKNEFDLIIASFVFHWIDRSSLLKSIAEIDRVLADKGFLLICDFFPSKPLKVKYHHLLDENVWTYKQDYSKIFTETNLYKKIAMLAGNEKNELMIEENENNRAFCILLQKDINMKTDINN